MSFTRRKFLEKSSQMSMVALSSPWILGHNIKEGLPDLATSESDFSILDEKMFFKISLAQWSLHKKLFSKEMDHLDFAKVARDFGLTAIEYVNQFFKNRAEDTSYLDEMNLRAGDNGVTQLLIMIDSEGGLAELDDKVRKQSVENHYKWVHAAKHLGCHSIRVNAFGKGKRQEVHDAAIDGLGSLSEYAAREEINVLVENHGGFSSDGKWLASVMARINMPNCGTLPDFGNFCVKRDQEGPWSGNCIEEYDRYVGVKELMPFAKAVSAKSNNFDDEGYETETDYLKMMKIVREHDYTGYVGIEYEGSELSEEEGIIATKKLLEKVRKQLSADKN